MTTVSLQYVGNKPEHVDDLYGTGTWQPGEKKPVEREIAPWLLNHADVWADGRTAAARKKDPIAPAPRPYKIRPDERDLAPLPVNLGVLDARGLASYAKSTYNRDLDTTQPVGKLRDEVRDLMRRAP